jgi:hypothetical protein
MGLFRREGVQKATIAEDGTVSTLINTEGYASPSILLPAEWTAADLFIQGSVDKANFADIADDEGTAVKITDAVIQANLGKWVTLVEMLNAVFPFKYICFRSANAQAAERSFTVALRS